MQAKIPVKPRLKYDYTVAKLGKDVLFLLSEDRYLFFRNEIFLQMLPFLDGNHTVSDIMTKIGKHYPMQDFFAAVNQLLQKGCLVEADGKPPVMHLPFWDRLGADAAEVADRLFNTRVSVHTLGRLEARGLIDCLLQNGIQVEEDGDLQVYAVEDYLLPELEEINRRNMESGRNWMLVKPVGMVLWIGPVFRPGETACWKCLEQRLRANRQVERFIQDRAGTSVAFQSVKAWLPTTLAAGIDLAVLEIAKSIVLGKKAGLVDKITTLDITSLKYQEHILVKRPQCPICGTIDVIETKPISIRSLPKVLPAISGHRTALPEKTYARFKHHISPITGVVTSLTKRKDDSNGLVNNYSAGHYFPIFSHTTLQLRINLLARSGAGGSNSDQAKTSTLCEALERYSGIYWGDEKKVIASFNELQPDAVHVRDLALFSNDQYRNRDKINKDRVSDQQFVIALPDDDAPISWSPAWSLTHDRFRYLPTGYCYYGYNEPAYNCAQDSNGNAAGNTIEEAILQGFLELVERDAVALWWYNRVRRPQVDTGNFNLPYWEEIETYYRRNLGRSIHVIDITTDLGIPAFAVISRRLDYEIEDITLGFSAHLDPVTAIIRALVGANQYLISLSERADDGKTLYHLTEAETIAWWKSATYENQPYLVPDPQVTPKTGADYANLAGDDIKEDLTLCIRIAREKDLEMMVVDQTRPDIGLPVVKVVVPGLRHFWRRLAPGRLYDAPVALGWLDQPKHESEMNPIDCFV